MKVTTEVINITPNIAKQFLKQNRGNRPMRPANVARFVKELTTGNFLLTHQGVAFDETGRLVDGQHRLTAIIETGISGKVTVTRGLDKRAYEVMDQPIKRSSGEILGRSAKVAQVVTLAARLMTRAEGSLTSAELKVFDGVVGDLTAELQDHCSANSIYFSSAPVRIAAIARILAGHSKEYVFDLYAKLCRAKINELPPIAASWMGQYVKGNVHAVNKNDTLARAMFAFDKKNANVSSMRKQDESLAIQYVVNAIEGAGLALA